MVDRVSSTLYIIGMFGVLLIIPLNVEGISLVQEHTKFPWILKKVMEKQRSCAPNSEASPDIAMETSRIDQLTQKWLELVWYKFPKDMYLYKGTHMSYTQNDLSSITNVQYCLMISDHSMQTRVGYVFLKLLVILQNWKWRWTVYKFPSLFRKSLSVALTL